MSNAVRKAIPNFLLQAFWLIEGLPLLYLGGFLNWYVLWFAVFLLTHQVVTYVMFGTVSYYTRERELPLLRPHAKTAFALLCGFTLIGSLISCVFWFPAAWIMGLLCPAITLLLLWRMYRNYFLS